MKLRNCHCDGADEEAMRAILNDVILTSTAIYDYQPLTAEKMRAWLALKLEQGFPVIGAFDDQGSLAGFATYGTFRSLPAYKYTVEHSVYVHRSRFRQGVGRQLMQALIDRAGKDQQHVLLGLIDADNHGSIALHESLGFQKMGMLKAVGFKFGCWLDVVIYQLTLETPCQPVDG